ncbi:hypothetical protein VLK31_19190 [Variovorax sp. H27-G14]|uniref:hypothetical protein n=1 Tax=Variovorax sp. H27-G14 TaxID=3111914 RepID=UPI0038FCFC7B
MRHASACVTGAIDWAEHPHGSCLCGEVHLQAAAPIDRQALVTPYVLLEKNE